MLYMCSQWNGSQSGGGCAFEKGNESILQTHKEIEMHLNCTCFIGGVLRANCTLWMTNNGLRYGQSIDLDFIFKLYGRRRMDLELFATKFANSVTKLFGAKRVISPHTHYTLMLEHVIYKIAQGAIGGRRGIGKGADRGKWLNFREISGAEYVVYYPPPLPGCELHSIAVAARYNMPLFDERRQNGALVKDETTTLFLLCVPYSFVLV